MRCEFCKRHHHLASCDVYKTAAERKARLRQLEKCLRCIKQSVPCKCKAKNDCRNCEQRHHFALCPRKFGGVEEGEIVDISGGPSPRASGRKREYASPSNARRVSSGAANPGNTTAVDDEDKKRVWRIKNEPPSCYFCKGPHRAEKCDMYDTALKRQEQAHIQGKCRRCLQPGHSTAECTSITLCPHCSRRHHVSLCFVMFGARRNALRSPTRSSSLSASEQRRHSPAPTTSKRPRYPESSRTKSSRSPKGHEQTDVSVQKSKKRVDEQRPRFPDSDKTSSSCSPKRRPRNEDSGLVEKLQKQLAEEHKMREDLRKAFQSNLDTLAKQKHEQLHMVNRELETLREVVDHYTRREKDMEDAKHLLDTERATFDEQKKQLELDRQALERERTQSTVEHERLSVETSTDPEDNVGEEKLATRQSDFKKIRNLEEELQNTRQDLQAATRLCQDAHHRIEEQFSKRRLLRDRYFQIRDERDVLHAEHRSLQLTIKFREQAPKRHVGRELQNLLHITEALPSAVAEITGAAQPSAESVRNAVARLQERIAKLQNEFSLEQLRLYSSFIGNNLNSFGDFEEIVAFLTTQVPESMSLAQAVVNLAQTL